MLVFVRRFRICSTDEKFKTRTTELTTYLLKRGYKRDFVTKRDASLKHTLGYLWYVFS